ncbi:hypothetical protein [Lentzea aerocolonigenes]|uniref:hypothetical protein n=1 Tax=Lentzea aerocolonigenes TaxID=68170 RepID=UPI0005ED0B90|nr:hypothetical protein [Lentzea aerocolonigenes]
MPPKRPDVLRGLSGRLIADIDRIERTRNYLWPGSVTLALESWVRYADSPARRLWLYDSPVDECECCPHPVQQRRLLDHVVSALPRKSARELRKRLQALDDLY